MQTCQLPVATSTAKLHLQPHGCVLCSLRLGMMRRVSAAVNVRYDEVWKPHDCCSEGCGGVKLYVLHKRNMCEHLLQTWRQRKSTEGGGGRPSRVRKH